MSKKQFTPPPAWITSIRETVCECANVNEAAHALNVTPKTIRDWSRNGKLKSTTIGSRQVFTKADLEEFMKAGGGRNA